ncbi:UDP-glucose:glycoprotein glucosyltransferase 1 [Penicillium canariense]|uniref:UDP-glucose:glycoprotein glucosyltransferase 1 n=1 Tax=Penicillium canariense TaxID=189055 RepID=A0A9W9LTC5_9EURO|nr:UDP-glucose:glycoprotein glucosyltransferase 1 [Penicillium canariense]KAJ5174782.1 UDP-glucose:glycoprotein glucosyltransferase 1 [Penicillium canariense]
MTVPSRSHPSWHWCAAIVALLPACLVSASPAVNVALQAPFDSSPYLLEMLETAAEENSTSYFPLLDRIADGAFEEATSEKELYDRFLQVVHEDGHLRTPESLSSFKLSLALRSSAPRIQAHYQYYNTSVQQSLMAAQDAACPVWVHLEGRQYCSSLMERAQQDVGGELDPRELPFDRVLGDVSHPPAVLYADVSAPMFKDFHETLSDMAKQGQISYRVRYRSPQHWTSRPLFVSGYGVELALKRTDYIVIDDRDAEQRDESEKDSTSAGSEGLKEDAPDDLRPLSSSEASRLGLNSASYVMDSEDPLNTLIKLSQNFPKYSSIIAAHNATAELRQEIRGNRARMIPAGSNVMWINGVQIDPRQIDAFSLLDHLRRERRLIAKFRDLGLSAQEAVKLLSHPTLAESHADDDSQRYDYRDTVEGGETIIWMNNLEKDSRYESWPSDLEALITNTYPGQLPQVRRDLHNVVMPVDLSSAEDVLLVVNQVQTFIKRMIPIRFGLVPTASSPDAISQLKVAHYLQKNFGLASLLHYLEDSASKGKAGEPDKASFTAVTKGRKPRAEKEALSFDQVLKGEHYDAAVTRTAAYQRRLSLNGEAPHFLVNGIPVSREGNWMQELSMLISRDLKLIQQAIVEGIFEEAVVLPEFYLAGAFERRNTFLMPEDPKSARIVDLANIFGPGSAVLDKLPQIEPESGVLGGIHIIVVGDFDSEAGLKLLIHALNFRKENGEVELLLVHNGAPEAGGSIRAIQHSLAKGEDIDGILAAIGSSEASETSEPESQDFTRVHRRLAEKLGFEAGAEGLVVNGRAVGPIPKEFPLSVEEISQLVAYERSKRIEPVAQAALSLGLNNKLSKPLDLAKLSSMVSLSTISDVPEEIFESAPDFRLDVSDKWKTEHSVITVSNSEDPAINVAAVLDPASEPAQRWLPILKVLSELAGVQLKIFLNPKDELKELPVKRFYRYVLESEPSFTADGSLSRPGASFTGVPVEALLTLGMDVPTSWLVAPKESVYDPDNIKLSTLKAGANVDAIYALEHILIEGHSRDVTTNSPPRGVQLVLGTEDNPHFADTIIMANLGYFQFKAQPGLWQINLKPGRSEKLFNLDSVGGLGYRPQPGDANTEVTLLSFQGRTLFPRLSRKPGHENDDVLEVGHQPGSTRDYLSKGLSFASGVLSSVGVGSKSGEQHADINIFSVASGHLYERMLNIMMVSVMRHTKHTVKFWFIEQFLSPSFRAFLPHLAEEYGFSYEMVTYKWPHWLRPQKEKQREIWGYKMLFLDVLFPLSLEKVIFVDADQIVRTDMYDLVTHDLQGAPYGFTPMGDSRTEMEGFRFWKQGYWSTFLRGKPYHISALYVVDLNRFRALAAGDRLRGQYQMLSADPNSLSNLDQDLPNHMQHHIPIHSLPQEWLWCETWCSDEDLASARTIDLCNNPQTKEPKLARARRQVPEWTVYDDEIAVLAKRVASEQIGFVQTGEDAAQKETVVDEEKAEEDRKDEL